MINLLPPEVKAEIKYAKRNGLLLRYLGIAGFVLGLLGALLVFALVYAGRQTSNYQQAVAAHQKEVAEFAATESQVRQLESNLGLINKLLSERPRYSALLTDLAKSLPPNSYIMHLLLTGDDKKPMELLVSTDSFNGAAEVRNGLISSRRIQSADIQSVTKNTDNARFTVIIVLAFEPGGSL